MLKVAVIVVEFTTVTPVTPRPPTPVNVVPVVVKLVPLIVTGTLLPPTPVFGVIEASVACGALPIVNSKALLVTPPGLVTATFLVPVVVVAEMLNVAVIVVSLTTVNAVTVIPPPPVTLIPFAPVKLVPVRVTATLLPLKPEFGAIEVRVGGGGFVTVNVTALLVPPGVVMLTFLAVSAAPPVMVKVAVTVVSLTTVRPVTVMPPFGVTVIAEAPVRLVPVRVTLTAVPLTPVLGVIEASVGAGMVTWDAIAPTALADPGAGGRGLP
jgi:hypothetical protein